MSENLNNKILELFDNVQNAEFGNYEWFFLSDLAQRVSLVSGFQVLLSLEDFNITLFPHQKEASLQVLQKMQGSALLADEVGLGKTIIALTILSELKLRNLVNSTLIVAPSSLINQWYNELIDKFNIETPVLPTGRSLKRSKDKTEFITSTTLMRRYPETILSRNWDMVIVDEAHRIKNRKTKGWKILNQIKKKYMLLLTATPMENYLKDIYNLTTLLKPVFGSYRNFRENFGVPGDKRACSNPLELRQILNQVMIRRKRGDIKGVFFPERIAKTLQFEMDEQESKLYHLVSDYVISSYAELEEDILKEAKERIQKKYNISSKRFFKRKIWLHKFTLMLLQRRICSSPYAALLTLTKMIETRKERNFDKESLEVLEVAKNFGTLLAHRESSKIKQLKLLVERIPNKFVIFTEFKDTLDYIADQFEKEGYSFITFSGDLSSKERAETIKTFRKEKDILLSTDAGSEGLNLQVANTIINFDLPWNPMRIEQRIGRVYRLTQKADNIYIFNLASKDTIEQYVLDLLYQKLGVFKTILGDLNHILGSLVNPNADGRSTQLEGEIMKFFIKHGHSEKLRLELENLIKPVVEEIDRQDKISKNVLDVKDLVDTY